MFREKKAYYNSNQREPFSKISPADLAHHHTYQVLTRHRDKTHLCIQRKDIASDKNITKGSFKERNKLKVKETYKYLNQPKSKEGRLKKM